MNPPVESPPLIQSLANLNTVPLVGEYAELWETARRSCGGPPTCRARLVAEARDLCVLAQSSGRLNVHWLDLAHGLRAKVEMAVTAPFLPDPNGPLQIASRAVLGVIYPPAAIFLPHPGHAFVRVLAPRGIWLPNASRDPQQILCLSPTIPAGTPLSQLLLIVYGALTMQAAQYSKYDAAGVVCVAAADWWQRNADRIPLSREPFLKVEASHES